MFGTDLTLHNVSDFVQGYLCAMEYFIEMDFIGKLAEFFSSSAKLAKLSLTIVRTLISDI